MPVSTASNSARENLDRGLSYMLASNDALAANHFDAALRADSAFALAYLYRALVSPLDAESYMESAKLHAQRATEAEQALVQAHVAGFAGDTEAEVSGLTALAERFPQDLNVLFDLGYTEGGRGNSAAAVAIAEQLLEADSTFFPAYNIIGYAEMEQGRIPAAEDAFRKQLKLAPLEANPYDSYGEFLLEEGRYEEAQMQFERALAIDPDLAYTRTNLVRLDLERLNRQLEAAFAKQDARACSRFYTQNASLSPPGVELESGRAAVAAYYQTLFAEGTDEIRLKTEEVFTKDDTAVEIGAAEMLTDGLVVRKARYSAVWLREGYTWRLHREMWNTYGEDALASGR